MSKTKSIRTMREVDSLLRKISRLEKTVLRQADMITIISDENENLNEQLEYGYSLASQ